jgi:hypothetical protein
METKIGGDQIGTSGGLSVDPKFFEEVKFFVSGSLEDQVRSKLRSLFTPKIAGHLLL